MKRFVSVFLIITFLLVSGIASAHGVHQEQVEGKLLVQVNGVEVKSDLNHVYKSKAYVSVRVFAELFEKTFKLASNKKSVTFNNKKISKIRLVKGEPTALINDLGAAVGAQKVSWDAKKQEAYVLVLPKGTIQLDPHVVPAMGEHWANPKDMPNGPIYGVYKGKLIFLEYMIAQDDFINGKNHTNLGGMKGLPSPSVVQTDIEFQPHGHPGFDIAHFDIHSYFISDEEQHKIGTTFFELKDDKGKKIGFAAFGQLGDQIILKVSASGLAPGKHGLHIHENAIVNNDFQTAGGHFNPSGKQHGEHNPDGTHLGDLPNLVVDENGKVDQTIFLNGLSLEKGKSNSVLGKSLIIHAKEDDGVTDPSGNSGDRVAGGNIPK
ncbi:superoxide dismutase family protein [Peribacillus asahii]|uniref:superoxide dismutase family protein n=1 Tax=Peribacillus asahii TaxID=228899 RepID=UPI00207AC7A1|nr:superoxide dismutase family protein [Peribacillus asahii]USK69617.1 superoxide dismutase family protein [Peribacillus asahii]